MDATPLGVNIDAGIGLSNGPQSAFEGLACIARFNDKGKIDASNGGGYAAATTIPYSANMIMTGRNLSVFIRDESVSDVRYKRWSIREIAPQ